MPPRHHPIIILLNRNIGGWNVDGGGPSGAGAAETELVFEIFPGLPVVFVNGRIIADDVKKCPV